MSIALNARIKELEQRVLELANVVAQMQIAAINKVDELDARIAALENRPKPGRPVKNG